MNQSERDRHSKTSLYPVVMAKSESIEDAEAKEMDENDPIHAAALEQSSRQPTPTRTPTRKSFLSRLLTPTRKSTFGYSKPTTSTKSSVSAVKSYEQVQDDSNSIQNLFSEATPVVKNTSQQQHQHSSIPQPQQLHHSHRVISHPLACIQTPPRRSSIPSSTTVTAKATASSCKTKTNTPTAAAPVAVATRLIAETSTQCTNTNNHNHHSNISNSNKTFDFDAVFGPTSSQATVYGETVGDAVTRNIFRGFHTTIIAYGQTASGKTYTMGGPRDAKVLAGEAVTPCTHKNQSQHANQHDDDTKYQVDPDDGIIPRAIHDLFQAKRKEQLSGGGRQVTVELTYLEIYNDELRDLLVETDDGHGMANNANANMSSPTPSNNNNSFLELRDHGDKVGVAVTGLTKLRVESVDQAKALMEQATLRRTTGSTRLNERSSRSHAICTLLVTIEQPPDGNGNATMNPNGSSRTRRGGSETITAKLTLVDLAGSERIKETGVVGIQKQESININKDLFVLGKVVSALSEKAKKGKGGKTHVPYRDSKLTRLLRDSIGGECV
jgi:hypothetical protein